MQKTIKNIDLIFLDCCICVKRFLFRIFYVRRIKFNVYTAAERLFQFVFFSNLECIHYLKRKSSAFCNRQLICFQNIGPRFCFTNKTLSSKAIRTATRKQFYIFLISQILVSITYTKRKTY